MRMLMRPQKAQLNPVLKVTASSTTWDRRKYMHAGYKTFECMLVGAAGGPGGRSYHNSNNYAEGAGGGGGGMLWIQGAIDKLPYDAMTVQAGVAGTAGTPVYAGVTGGTGTTGGESVFGGWSARGGVGGGGGRVDYSTNLGGSANLSDGGDGGNNSQLIGTPGVGSTGLTDGEAPNHTAATAGSATTQQIGNYTMIGGGGGGGETGVTKTNGQIVYAANAAAKAGNVHNTEGTSGPGGATTSSKGGCGGGANIAPITGGPAEYYGSSAAGSSPDGVFYLKVS